MQGSQIGVDEGQGVQEGSRSQQRVSTSRPMRQSPYPWVLSGMLRAVLVESKGMRRHTGHSTRRFTVLTSPHVQSCIPYLGSQDMLDRSLIASAWPVQRTDPYSRELKPHPWSVSAVQQPSRRRSAPNRSANEEGGEKVPSIGFHTTDTRRRWSSAHPRCASAPGCMRLSSDHICRR